MGNAERERKKDQEKQNKTKKNNKGRRDNAKEQEENFKRIQDTKLKRVCLCSGSPSASLMRCCTFMSGVEGVGGGVREARYSRRQGKCVAAREGERMDGGI